MYTNTTRPRPLRIAATVIGGLLALVHGLVGAGLFTSDQGNGTTTVINAAVALAAAFGVVLVGERHVTPLDDPRDDHGRALVPADDPDELTTD